MIACNFASATRCASDGASIPCSMIVHINTLTSNLCLSREKRELVMK
jgi:hypothetical protein